MHSDRIRAICNFNPQILASTRLLISEWTVFDNQESDSVRCDQVKLVETLKPQFCVIVHSKTDDAAIEETMAKYGYERKEVLAAIFSESDTRFATFFQA